MRTFGAVLLATSLMASSAIAAPLSPGKPAGVQKAQMAGTSWILIVGGLGLVGLGIGLAASTGNGNAVVNSTSASVGTNP